VIARRTAAGWRLLMLRAYRNWDFPKGLVEPDEEVFSAALREVAEETTLTDLAFPWGEVYIETAPYAHNKVARYYLAETVSETVALPIQPELGRPEHHEWRWLSEREARACAAARLQPVLAWAGRLLSPEPASS
jgi:8-oxo-dGTP pyrophosphatase MutT (NUDIX family)